MGDTQSVLVVDDEALAQLTVLEMLRDSRFVPEFASSVDEALLTMQRDEFAAVLTDVRMPGASGIDLVREARRIQPEIPVLLMTGFASIDSAVESMLAGALDYITKPFKRKRLLCALERACEPLSNRQREKLARSQVPPELFGSSLTVDMIAQQVEKIAATRSNVLITGESGTGKERVARMIHVASMPANSPLIPIDCAAIPEGLLETELFGHIRGAFTGATQSKKGLFEIANGGTVFLDEIGDMALGLQAKLLRVLQEREIRRIGDTRVIKIDVRVVAATNKNLRTEIAKGNFREDLFYRLNVIPFHLSPLRDHPEDIPELAKYFVRLKSPEAPLEISPAAMKQLEKLPWGGNIRELENVIERAVAFSDGKTIVPNDLRIDEPSGVTVAAESDALFQVLASQRIPLREIEDRAIAAALQIAHGNKVRAARALGISRRTLYRRDASACPASTDNGYESGRAEKSGQQPLDA